MFQIHEGGGIFNTENLDLISTCHWMNWVRQAHAVTAELKPGTNRPLKCIAKPRKYRAVQTKEIQGTANQGNTEQFQPRKYREEVQLSLAHLTPGTNWPLKCVDCPPGNLAAAPCAVGEQYNVVVLLWVFALFLAQTMTAKQALERSAV